MEQFDKSGQSWNVPLQRDWRIINHVLNVPRYYFNSFKKKKLVTILFDLSEIEFLPKNVVDLRYFKL